MPKRQKMFLAGKVIVVTGASASVGRALALEFARQGASIICAARREGELRETINQIEDEGGTALLIPTDVTDCTQVDRLFTYALDHFGRVDILFNNAGSLGAVGATWEIDIERWRHDVEVNLFGTYYCCRAILPHMIKRDSGVIINMDGGGGTPGPNIGGSAYGCSKAAILRFTESMAGELERIGSSVMTVCMNPGFVVSEMTKNAVNTPYKAEWLSHVVTLLASDEGVPVDQCAKSTVKLLKILSPELNGRDFRQDTDYDLVAQNKNIILKKNLLVLRYAGLKNADDLERYKNLDC